MKTKFTLNVATRLLSLLTLMAKVSTAHAQGTAFTYQGRLNDGANPANGTYNLRFALFDALTVGSQVGSPFTNPPVSVSNGLFTVTLDFGSQFPGADRWLEIGVRTNGAATFSTLSPRQKLAATPYAITAGYVTAPVPAAQLSGTLASSSLTGTYGNPVTFNNPADSFSGNGGGLTNVNGATLGGLGANQFWKTGGNSNTVAGTNFLGTADDQPVEVRVNNTRALRVEPGGTNAPNVVWGHPANSVTPGVVGAVIGGGGGFSVTSGGAFPNRVTDSHGVVGGGLGNVAGDGDADPANTRYATVGGGFLNTAAAFSSTLGGGYQNATLPSATYSVIAGGYSNTNMGEGGNIGGGFNNKIKAGGALSTIGGGNLNTVTANNATVAGGSGNSAAGSYAAIGGGVANTASGFDATVPGGSGNVASGDDSFAAGSAAYATHSGSFVWSDPSSSFVFGSTTTNQFSVRATGGVRFETAGAGMTLDGQTVALLTGGNNFSGQQMISGGDAGQLILQNSADNRSWYIYDEYFNGSGALIFQPSSPGVGAYIRRSDGNYIVNSDARLKQDIVPIGEVLNRVLQLRPVSYRFRSAPGGTPLTLGLIAQEVEPLFPEVVGEHGGVKSMAYSELIPVTIRAVQELSEKMDSENAKLREELKLRDTENAELKQRLEALEKIIRNPQPK